MDRSSDGLLFLIKSSRVREYHQQNLAIMAAPDGATFEISYGRRWVQPGATAKVGDGACIVFADSPYREFAPIRWAVVDSIEDSESRITLGVRVQAFVLGTETLINKWAADADADYAVGRKDTSKARPYFLFREPNPKLRNPNGWLEETQAWRDAAERLATNGFFEGARFARVASVESVTGVPIELPGSLGANQEIVARIELAGGTQPDAIIIESEPTGFASLSGPVEFDDDGAAIPLIVEGQGEGTVRFNLAPEPMRSSRPAIRLSTLDEQTRGPVNIGTADSTAVRRLVTALQRTTAIDAATWVSLFEDHLVPLSGDDDELLMLFAEHTYKLGDWARTIDATNRITQRSPRAELIEFAARARIGQSADVADLDRIDLDDGPSLALLIEALADSPSQVVQQIAPALWGGYLGGDRVVDLVRCVWPRITDPSIAADAAIQVAYSDIGLAKSLIIQRWPDASQIDTEPLRVLIEDLAAAEESTAPYLERWIRQFAAQGDWAGLADQAQRVRRLPSHNQTSLMAAIATDLMASGNNDADDAGFDLICEALRVSSRSGDLETAGELVDAVVGACLDNPNRRAMIDPLLEQLDELLEQSPTLADWRALHRERLADTIGRAFVNKTLRLVGDIERPWEDSIRDTFQLKRVVRHPSEKHKSPNTDWLSAVDRDEDIVLIVFGRIGHALSIPVINHCRMANISHRFAELGERGVIAALAQLASNNATR